jgi:hypothetical protein
MRKQYRLTMKKRSDGKNQRDNVKGKNQHRFAAKKPRRPLMTRELAEARAVGTSSGPKFDGTAFLQSLKK